MSAIDVQALLQSHAPHAPERLRARVAELAPAPHRRIRRAFVLVPVAVALAVAAAVVHGIVGSGSHTARHDLALEGQVHASAPTRRVGAGAALTWTTATQAQFAPSVGSGGRLQHTEASLQVRVPDVKRLGAVTTAATQIATSLGGYAQSVVYRTPEGGGGASFLELRVPAQNVRVALTKLAALGTLVSQQLSVNDLQHDFEVE